MSVDNVNSKRSLLENINKIANTDKLSDFVDKCNDNFTAIVKNGGGPKGDRGVKGDQGNPTKPKVPIHVWKKDVDYESETQTETGFEITYEDDILSDVKYQENHLILLENTHVYKLVLDLDTNTLKPKFVFELQYFNPDDIKKTNLHIACADSYDGNEYDGFEVMTNTLKPIQKPYVGICINDDDEDSESLNNPLIYNWIYIGGFGSGPGDSGGPGSGPGDSGGPGSGPGSGSGDGKCIYVTLLNDNGSFIYSDSNKLISDPVSTIARLEINGEPVKAKSWSCKPTNVTLPPIENYNGEEYTEDGYIGQKFEVTGISGNNMSGSLTITATYGDHIYPKVFSLRKYINESIYDIKPTVNTLTLLDTLSDVGDTKSIDIYFQIKETTINNKHIYYPRVVKDGDKDNIVDIFDDSNVLNLSIELIQETDDSIKLEQLNQDYYSISVTSDTNIVDTVDPNGGSKYYYKLNIKDVIIDDVKKLKLKDYNTLRININKDSGNFKEYEDISIVSIESSLDISAGYLSSVFTRSDTKPAIPTGGSWKEPVPTDPKGKVTWYDGIPPGIEQLYESHATINSDGTAPVWSDPDPMIDSFNAKYIFSTQPIPQEPGPNNESMVGPKFSDEYWTDDVRDSENTLWKAESYFTNGKWGLWQVCKIKGEKGNDGTSISIQGSGIAVNEIPEGNSVGNVILYNNHTVVNDNGEYETIPWIYLWNKDANNGNGDWVKYDGNKGEAYVIDGELYVWDGDTWENCGRFKGDDGVSQFVHIKYANDDPNGTKIKYQGKDIYISFTDSNKDDVNTDDNDGETPGSYVGIRVDEKVLDSNNIEDYEWHKWNGEDGWGYDYIYYLSDDTYKSIDNPPIVPNCNGPYDPKNKNNFGKWTDDPQEVTEKNPYCWVCYSQFINGAWTKYKGKKKNNYTEPRYGVLWSKWSKDGGEGTSIILDLDNQHDSLIYDDKGNCVSEPVKTTAKLYVNGVAVNAKFSIFDYFGCTIGNNDDNNKYNDISNINGENVVNNGTEIAAATIIVNGLEDGVASGYVDIKATYNSKSYIKRFNIKKLINQCKYQIITKPTAISYNDDVNSAEVNIKIRKTDGKGKSSILTSQSELTTDKLSLVNEVNDVNDFGSISDYGKNGATLTLSSLDNITNVNIKLIENKGTDSFVQDSEDIPVFKGGTGPEGPEGKSTVTIYKASYDKPDTPTIDEKDWSDKGWTNDLSTIQVDADIEISHGGLWSYLGNGTYMSPDIFSSISGACSSEEKFTINNKSSKDINLPAIVRSTGGSYKKNNNDVYCTIGGISELNEEFKYERNVTYPIENPNNKTKYYLTKDYPDKQLKGDISTGHILTNADANGEQTINLMFKNVISNNKYNIWGLALNNNDMNYAGNVIIQFGNTPIWKCEYKVSGNSAVPNSMSNPIKTSEVSIKTTAPTANSVNENLLFGSRFKEYRRGCWQLVNKGYNDKNYYFEYEESFNGNNAFVQYPSDNKQHTDVIVSDYVLWDSKVNDNTIEADKSYTLSFRSKGTEWRARIIGINSSGVESKIKEIESRESDLTYIYTTGSFSISSQLLSLYSQVILRFIFSDFYDSFTIDNKTYPANNSLVPGKLLMPKLEEGEVATEFTVNDLDIGSKRNAPIRINTWAENTVYSSGERDSDKYTDIVIYDGNYYRCLINHTSIKDNPPISTDGIVSKYWEAATDYNFIATKILLAEKAYIKNLVAECIRTAPEMDNNEKNKWQSRFVAEGNEIAFYGTKKYPAMRMSVDDDGNGYLAFIDQGTGKTEYILNAAGLKKYSEVQIGEYIEKNSKYRILKDNNKNNITEWVEGIVAKVFEQGRYTPLYVYRAPSNENLITLAESDECNNMFYDFEAKPNQKYTTSNSLTAYAVIASETETGVMYAEDICGQKEPTWNNINNALEMQPIDYIDKNYYYTDKINWAVEKHSSGNHVYKSPIYYKTLYKFDNGKITQVPIRIYKQRNSVVYPVTN